MRTADAILNVSFGMTMTGILLSAVLGHEQEGMVLCVVGFSIVFIYMVYVVISLFGMFNKKPERTEASG